MIYSKQKIKLLLTSKNFCMYNTINNKYLIMNSFLNNKILINLKSPAYKHPLQIHFLNNKIPSIFIKTQYTKKIYKVIQLVNGCWISGHHKKIKITNNYFSDSINKLSDLCNNSQKGCNTQVSNIH